MKIRRSWLCWAFMLVGVNAVAAPVPDTGQTKCYDAAGNVITCPSAGQPFYGQDADYSINPMSYTKLDGRGNALHDSAKTWAMVRDNVTGLTWEVKQNMDGAQDYSNPHDADNTYTWYDGNQIANGENADASGNGTDTKAFIKALNDAHFGCHSDWRLPTIKELDSIVKYDIPYPGPTINSTYFPNTQSSYYWSSTNYAYIKGFAWGVYFYYGYDYNDYKDHYFYVRAVRGGKSHPTYVDNGNGTVSDTSTGLMWQQDTADNTMTWEQALSYCENSTLADFTDWRLPTKKELRSLVDYSRYNPAIDTTYFPDTASSFYWSSTTSAYGTYAAWGEYFYDGYDLGSYKSNYNHVRAVRRGHRPITINIKPEGHFNRINLRSDRNVSVAILSTTDFDAPGQIDRTSLTFGSTGDEQSLVSCDRRPKDVDHDGIKDDLVCHFSIKSAGFKCGDTVGILKGETAGGMPIMSKDSVIIIPCK